MNKSIFQKSAFWLLLFFAFAVWGFWRSYFSLPDKDISFYLHFHGIAMTLWCLMLIGQAFLIRFKKYRIHRFVGKTSYFIFPILIISTFLLIHFRLSSASSINSGVLRAMSLMSNATLVLMIIYGLGMYFRKDPLTHARYMICTIFPLFTPVTDRIIYNYIPQLIPLAPTIEGRPFVPFYGFLMADLIVIGLAVWDWKTHKRKDAFLIVLGLLLMYHISMFTFYKFSFWRAFTEWFLSLNLT